MLPTSNTELSLLSEPDGNDDKIIDCPDADSCAIPSGPELPCRRFLGGNERVPQCG